MPEGSTHAAPVATTLRGADLPAGLDALADPPDALHVSGTWPGAPLVAIVGARAATAYGLAIAHRLAGDLARLGYAIVSGLARGIDAAAHVGALEAGGLTVAVLPGSLDTITPPSNAPLARRIERHGALAAEWAHGMPATRGLFLRRNRLIAGVARATVVVEAAGRSGALSTAAVARHLGRPVLAVPGDIDRPSSRGCLELLRGGARVCAGAADVLASLDAVAPALPSPAGSDGPRVFAGVPAASNDASRVAAALEPEPRSLDTLARHAGVTPERVLGALLQLEWAGVAIAHPGPRWSRAGGAAG